VFLLAEILELADTALLDHCTTTRALRQVGLRSRSFILTRPIAGLPTARLGERRLEAVDERVEPGASKLRIGLKVMEELISAQFKLWLAVAEDHGHAHVVLKESVQAAAAREVERTEERDEFFGDARLRSLFDEPQRACARIFRNTQAIVVNEKCGADLEKPVNSTELVHLLNALAHAEGVLERGLTSAGLSQIERILKYSIAALYLVYVTPGVSGRRRTFYCLSATAYNEEEQHYADDDFHGDDRAVKRLKRT